MVEALMWLVKKPHFEGSAESLFVHITFSSNFAIIYKKPNIKNQIMPQNNFIIQLVHRVCFNQKTKRLQKCTNPSTFQIENPKMYCKNL